jgi:hypothetical protein
MEEPLLSTERLDAHSEARMDIDQRHLGMDDAAVLEIAGICLAWASAR